jgi:predicted permease
MDARFEFTAYALCVLAGYFLGTKNILSEGFWTYLVRALVWIIYPGLIFHGITRGYTKTTLEDHLVLPVAGFGIMLLGFFLAHGFLKTRKQYSAKRRATMGALATMGNYIFLPYPIAKLLWGEAAGHAVLLTSLGSDIGVWTLGVAFLHKGGGINLKKLINPPLVALMAAVSLVYFEIVLPPEVLVFKARFGLLGLLTVPVAMLFLGYNLKGTKLSTKGFVEFTPVMIIQLLLIPLGVWQACLFFELPNEIARVLYLISAMPSAIACVLLSKLYDGDARLAARGVLMSHIAATLTAPIFLYLVAF